MPSLFNFILLKKSGIVSASEGLSENYLLNATGGWTSIDEELDPDSTNPVQNKTLYNLETYHTLTNYKGSGTEYIIDDGLNIPVKTPIKLFFDKDLESSTVNDYNYLMIRPNISTHPRRVSTTSEKNFIKINNGNTETEHLEGINEFLAPHFFLTGFDTEALPVYTGVFVKANTAFEIFLPKSNGDFVIVGNPIVGRYRYNRSYNPRPSWGIITAEAIVFASGLKIQWGNFKEHSTLEEAIHETYFPVKFKNIPSMSFTFDTNVGSGALDADVVHRDTPYAVTNEKWKLHSAAEGTYGTWMAIGY